MDSAVKPRNDGALVKLRNDGALVRLRNDGVFNWVILGMAFCNYYFFLLGSICSRSFTKKLLR